MKKVFLDTIIVVLTRNKKDFIEASVPVMTPDEFFMNE